MYISALAYALVKDNGLRTLVLKDNDETDEVYSACNFFLPFFNKNLCVCKFPSYEISPYSSIPPSLSIVAERIKTLYGVMDSFKQFLLITNIKALLQPTISEESFLNSFFTLSIGQEISLSVLSKKLVELRYKRTNFVESVGEFSIRGSVVDIFSPRYDKPVRIEFFDEEIETIKLFYIANQRTFQSIDSVEILVSSEYQSYEDSYGYANIASKDLCHISEYDNILSSKIYKNFDCDFAKETLSGLKLYSKENRDIFLDEKKICKFFDKSSDFDDFNSFKPLFPDNLDIQDKIDKIKLLTEKNRVIVACASSTRRERVKEFLEEKGFVCRDADSALSAQNGLYLSANFLKKGFVDDEEKIAFVSFEDLFGKAVYKNAVRHIQKIKTFEENSKVVHKYYGVGIYRGIKKIEVDGKAQDFLEIEYKSSDILYLPIFNSGVLFEYYGDAELDSLRSNQWIRKKDNIKKSIKKILSELVNTYAKREIAHREPFDTDMYEYKEFEAMFEYEETYDQAAAISDIKKDLSSNKPMDRLICGDVSFGKTEVAMRAIAISVFNGKQAVLMSPTTILSIQHFNTFLERFKNFPVNIALLNSFVTDKERKSILDRLAKGLIDILISTHSVYSDKVAFSNLGLVVVDEEQRFGVKVKEHLKSRYPNVDMLYLSATPIPRTLNMALGNILDISIIKTPPINRKPIETFVLKRKRSVIKDAILKELSRNGSIYFVHNNIDTIEDVKSELDTLIPFAKKKIVHAKMPKSNIRTVIEEFNKGEFDILIATSIIESGLDIKNVNTIIVDRADMFGLSDLYQLRGRVGRGTKVSYAYLLTGKTISEKARKRLQYMKEFVERGVGFNLALKDMELRGGGNILGKNQSGKIKSIGFETYTSLIEEALMDMKNQPVQRDVEIKCRFEAYIPDNFADSENKLIAYKTIYSALSQEEIEEIEGDFKDKFGALNEEVKNLFTIARLKLYAKAAFVKKIIISEDANLIEFYSDAAIDTDKLIKVTEMYKGRFISEFSVLFDKIGSNLDEIYNNLKNILQKVV